MIVVFRVPVQPKLSVAVTETAPFNTVLVGVPDTTPVVGIDGQARGEPGRAPGDRAARCCRSAMNVTPA